MSFWYANFGGCPLIPGWKRGSELAVSSHQLLNGMTRSKPSSNSYFPCRSSYTGCQKKQRIQIKLDRLNMIQLLIQNQIKYFISFLDIYLSSKHFKPLSFLYCLNRRICHSIISFITLAFLSTCINCARYTSHKLLAACFLLTVKRNDALKSVIARVKRKYALVEFFCTFPLVYHKKVAACRIL